MVKVKSEFELEVEFAALLLEYAKERNLSKDEAIKKLLRFSLGLHELVDPSHEVVVFRPSGILDFQTVTRPVPTNE